MHMLRRVRHTYSSTLVARLFQHYSNVAKCWGIFQYYAFYEFNTLGIRKIWGLYRKFRMFAQPYFKMKSCVPIQAGKNYSYGLYYTSCITKENQWSPNGVSK